MDIKRYGGKDNHKKNEPFRVITESSLYLEPLCEEVSLFMHYITEKGHSYFHPFVCFST